MAAREAVLPAVWARRIDGQLQHLGNCRIEEHGVGHAPPRLALDRISIQQPHHRHGMGRHQQALVNGLCEVALVVLRADRRRRNHSNDPQPLNSHA
jgi:hypothetical protein